VAKYGEHVLGNVRVESTVGGISCSTWWKDLCCLDSHGEWFRRVVAKRVGRGNSCRFWKDTWVDNQPLEQRFPRLFSISTQKDEVISEVGSWRDGVWR
jgi:hypothetical protein